MKKLIKNVLGALSILLILPSFAFAVDDVATATPTLDSAFANIETEEDFNKAMSDLINSSSDDIIGGLSSVDWASVFEWLLESAFTFVLIALVSGLIGYIYCSLTMYKIAKRLDEPNAWFAWVPILNSILMLRLGELSPWLLLLGFIPAIGALALTVIFVLATMNICGRRGYDKALGLLSLVPIANLVLYGVLAWGKGNK